MPLPVSEIIEIQAKVTRTFSIIEEALQERLSRLEHYFSEGFKPEKARNRVRSIIGFMKASTVKDMNSIVDNSKSKLEVIYHNDVKALLEYIEELDKMIREIDRLTLGDLEGHSKPVTMVHHESLKNMRLLKESLENQVKHLQLSSQKEHIVTLGNSLTQQTALPASLENLRTPEIPISEALGTLQTREAPIPQSLVVSFCVELKQQQHSYLQKAHKSKFKTIDPHRIETIAKITDAIDHIMEADISSGDANEVKLKALIELINLHKESIDKQHSKVGIFTKFRKSRLSRVYDKILKKYEKIAEDHGVDYKDGKEKCLDDIMPGYRAQLEQDNINKYQIKY